MEPSEAKKGGAACAGAIREEPSREFDYLCVDDFLGDLFQARALAAAFETGLIDALVQSASLSYRSLMEKSEGAGDGPRLLIALLRKNRVVEECDGAIRLTAEFLHALQFRDLMELRISLANLAAHDFVDHFSDLVFSPDRFFSKAKFLRLFSYDRCFGNSREDYEATERWMKITTTLTKYEAQACLQRYDFGRHCNMLDIGGNSGEFALRICRKFPAMRATVFDLPLVCEVGRKHIEREPEVNRIAFIQGNALIDPLPEGVDLVTFKSMLHDWPEKEARQFITNASRSLALGGTLLIFERGPFDISEIRLGYSLIPFLLFYHSFRPSMFYENELNVLGFRDIIVRPIYLDTPFFIVMATKGSG